MPGGTGGDQEATLVPVSCSLELGFLPHTEIKIDSNRFDINIIRAIIQYTRGGQKVLSLTHLNER